MNDLLRELLSVHLRFRRPPDRFPLVADALGLALFTVDGTRTAVAAGLPGMIASIVGVITGVAGGVVRDVLTAEIPLILRGGELYATASITGAALCLLLVSAGVQRPLSTLLGMGSVVLLRFASILGGLQLPVFALADQRDERTGGDLR